MSTTKLIYGVGRVPKASEFSLGEIIVNVDDSKVYSKNKSNIVFQIGGGGTTIINGESSGLGFTTASISASGFFTSTDTSNLIISGGTGVSVTTGSNNQIIITATGDAEITHVISADTASYIEASNIDGTLFEFISDESQQGGIWFSDNIVNSQDSIVAQAFGLLKTDNVTFAQVSSSGLLFASASEETTGGDNIRVIVYDTASGQFYFTGSYGGSGGSGGDDGDWYNGGTFLSSSVDIRVGGIVSSSRLTLDNNVELRNQNGNLFITNKVGGGITGSGVNFIESDVNDFNLLEDSPLITLDIGGNTSTISIGQNSTAGAINLGPTNDANHTTDIGGQLLVRKNATFYSPITASSHISASGLLYASASEETTGGDNIRTVVYDTASGQFYFTGSYGAGTDITEGDANRVLFYNSSGQLDSSSYLYFGNFEAPGINEGYREFRVGIGAGGRVNSYAGKFNHISSSIYRHNGDNIDINSNSSRIAFGNNQIDFRTYGENFDYKGPRMSLTLTELRIGSHSNDIFGAFDELSPVDVIVTGSINTTNYLRLDATGSNTIVSAIAGALMYSASNEFYLGFS